MAAGILTLSQGSADRYDYNNSAGVIMKKHYLGILPLIFSPLFANAADTIFLDSVSGDYIGGGNTYTFTDSTGDISLTTSNDELKLDYDSPDHYVRLTFVAPSGEAMRTQHYLNAQRAPFKSPGRPGISVSMDGRGCNTIDGDFFIHQLDLNAATPVVALDFVQYCGNNSAPLTGSIRMNSGLAAPLPYPVAVIDSPLRHLLEGEEVTLNGNKSFSSNSSIISGQWEQTSGTPITLNNPSSMTPTFTVPELPLSGTEITLLLSVVDSQGLTDEKEVTLPLVSKSAPLTFLELHSEAGDYIGQGKDWYFDDAFNAITASINYDNGVSANIDTGSFWRADFAAPYDAPLTNGHYDPAERFPFQDTIVAGLDIGGDGRGCNTLSGSFTVLDIVQQAESVERFMADFTQYCESETNPPLTGRLSINARHPSVPSAEAGTDILAAPNQTLSLEGGNSTDDGRIVTYQWSVDHPGMSLINANQPQAQLVTPDMAGGETIEATVTLVVTDDLGFKDQDSIQVSVEQNNSAPVANDDHIQFSHKHGVTFNPLNNDYDPDGNLDTNSLEIISSPQSGSVQVFSDGSVKYLPNHPSIKTDTFVYQVKDLIGALSQPATVHLSR
jgi:hypothetical protein